MTTSDAGTQGDPADDHTGAAADATPPATDDGQGPDAGTTANDSPQDRKLTRENQSLRARLRDAEAALKTREEADLSEAELAKRRAADAEAKLAQRETQLRDVALRADIARHAQTLGIVDPDAASKLIDTTSIVWDDEKGTWQGVDSALRDLAHEKPWLTSTASGTGSTDTHPTNPAKGRGSRLTREALSKMTQAEVNALSDDEIAAALAGG